MITKSFKNNSKTLLLTNYFATKLAFVNNKNIQYKSLPTNPTVDKSAKDNYPFMIMSCDNDNNHN